MNLKEYTKDLKPALAGYLVLKYLYPQCPSIPAPYPPDDLSSDELTKLKSQINDCIPRSSMIVDLWDWNVHFEHDLSEEWYFSTIFGKKSSLQDNAKRLTDFFLQKFKEFDIDTTQSENYAMFADYVFCEAEQFIINWQNNVQTKFVPVN